MAEDPLLTRTVQCPACEREVPMRLANPRLYTVTGRESDRHVTGYRWLHGIVTPVLPHHYKVWQCPKCLYADLADHVEGTPGRDREARLRAFRDIPIEKRMILDSLRERVPAGDLDGDGAIAIHLAALLITALPPDPRRLDHGKLGRLALRLAWLFRERGGPAQPEPAPAVPAPALALGEAAERLDQVLEDAAGAVRNVRARSRELGLPEGDADPVAALVDLVELRFDALRTEVASLQSAVRAPRPAPAAAPAAPAAPAGALDRELQALVTLWPDLPRDEPRSLRLALEALEYSYQNEGDGESVEQGVAQVNLILDLLIRLGELDRALEWTSHVSKSAFDTGTELRERRDKARAAGTLSAYDNTMLSRKLAALGHAQQKAGESRHQVLALLRERDRERIGAILAEAAHLPEPERLKALAKAGINDGVVALVAKELAAAPRESTGWFQSLFHQ